MVFLPGYPGSFVYKGQFALFSFYVILYLESLVYINRVYIKVSVKVLKKVKSKTPKKSEATTTLARLPLLKIIILMATTTTMAIVVMTKFPTLHFIAQKVLCQVI